MQKRAARFRIKQKKEIEKLKMVASGQVMPQEQETVTPHLGKRSAASSSSYDRFEEMEKKIQRLE